MRRCIAPLAAAAVLATAAACTTSAGPPEPTTGPKPYVSRIELSRTSGEVGRPFQAEVAYHASHVREPEYSVSSLPPGLRFDSDEGTIVGVPEATGFFTVTVAIRNQRGPGMHFATPKTAWFTETFELAIYQPVEGVTAEASDAEPEPVARF